MGVLLFIFAKFIIITVITFAYYPKPFYICIIIVNNSICSPSIYNECIIIIIYIPIDLNYISLLNMYIYIYI